MKDKSSYAIVIPMANEADNVRLFYKELIRQLTKFDIDYKLYLVTDTISKDGTIQILQKLSARNNKVKVIFEPKNRNVVDAYVRGFKQAIRENNDYIIEMDAGFSHQPSEIIKFIKKLRVGYDCVFGVRPLMSHKYQISLKRRIFSLGGTLLSNVLLGTKLPDATSGFEAFKSNVLKKILKKQLMSKGHFFQTEIRYRAKEYNISIVNIHYSFPSNSVSQKSIMNSFQVLFTLFLSRVLNH